MTKSDLIARVSAIYPYMNVKNVERVISIIIDSISNKLRENGRVELRDFGAFSIKARKPVEGRNPRNGEKVIIGSKKIPFFKAGRRLKDLINGRDTKSKERKK